MKPGPRNLITDVAGLLVGNAEDEAVRSGVTVVLPEEPAVAAAEIRGGAPGTRETDALDPACLVERIHGLVLAGGSVYGLEAASAVTDWLGARGRGFAFGAQPRVAPVVAAANLFDLTNGGDKEWGDDPPYRGLGRAACEAAAQSFALGNAGAGYGASAGAYKGGLGSASVIDRGLTAGALAAVNSYGAAVAPGTDVFWAAPLAFPGELGEQDLSRLAGVEREADAGTKAARIEAAAGANTTLAVVATDAALSKAEARRIALMASDGLARALRPSHSPFDGDSVFVLATGKAELGGPRPLALARLGTLCADALARAIARGVYEAESLGELESYRARHGRD